MSPLAVGVVVAAVVGGGLVVAGIADDGVVVADEVPADKAVVAVELWLPEEQAVVMMQTAAATIETADERRDNIFVP